MKLSACLIVRNEHDLLPKCLDSIREFDEIVIMDTGSTDDTVEIAKKYTDKVYFFKWCDSFYKARNFANSKATGDWILIVDADEYLKTPVSEIRKAIETKEEVLNVRSVSETGSEHFYSPRLFRNKPDIFWKGDIHNHLSKRATVNTDIEIVYGYSPAHKKDPNRALRILTKTVKENPKSVRERYYLAREYWYRSKWKKCIAEINRYLKVAIYRAEIADAYLMKARCYWNIQEGEKARLACMHAIYTSPDFKEAFIFMSEMNFEPRKSKWLLYSKLADNEDVLFVRT